MRIYDEFCAAVTAQVHNATPQEKAAIRQELAEHLEDHAAYLTEEHGLSPEEASEAAIAAMGDPKEIGRELGKKYPAWPNKAAAIMKILIAILCILLVYSIWYHDVSPIDNLAARIAPSSVVFWPSKEYHATQSVIFRPNEEFQAAQTVDYRWTLNGQVFYVYRISRTTDLNDEPIVWMWICNYNENPFRRHADAAMRQLQFRLENGAETQYFRLGGQSNSGACYAIYEVSVTPEDTVLTICLRNESNGFSVDIPLPESEVQP